MVMSATMDWHLGHVVRLMGGRGSGSIEATINRHPKDDYPKPHTEWTKRGGG